jgi:hypothetical protein
MSSTDKINISFPNDGPISIDFDIVSKWDIENPKEIGDTVFFWYGGLYLSVDKKEFDRIINANKKMRIFFLDIDGVLNNCTATGVFAEDSTDIYCIAVLNEALRRTGAKIVIISSWKDNFDFQLIRDLLYQRGVLEESIISATERDIPKEEGIKNFLAHSQVEEFIIIDDNLDLQDQVLKNFCVRTNSHEGLVPEDLDRITSLFK